jgi:osmotically inducible protein OsmC
VDGAPTISRIELSCDTDVADIDDAAFQELAERAKASCPVSRALAGVRISLEARRSGA